MSNVEEAVQELRTIRDLIRWGMSLFNRSGLHFGHGTDNPLDEAAYLTLNALRLPPTLAEGYLDARLTASERRACAELLTRRVTERKPAAYLTREAWFAGLQFYVDERVLIPRSPTAELIEERFEPWVEPDQVGRILDMCTGSGCIAIACASYFPEAEVVAADLSEEALAVARINVENHGLWDQLRLVHSDLFSALAGERFDIIITNPPYVEREEMAQLPPEYHHEPAMALEAGHDGLDFALRLLRDAPDHLNEGGILVLEVGASQYFLEELLPEVPFTWLEFERGGDGVLLMTLDQLNEHHEQFARAAAERPGGA